MSQKHNRHNVAARFIHLPLAASKWSSRLHLLGFIRFWTLSLLLPPVPSRSVGSDSFRRTVVASVPTGVLDRDPRSNEFCAAFCFLWTYCLDFCRRSWNDGDLLLVYRFCEGKWICKNTWCVYLYVMHLSLTFELRTGIRRLKCTVTLGTALRYVFWPIFLWFRKNAVCNSSCQENRHLLCRFFSKNLKRSLFSQIVTKHKIKIDSGYRN